MQFLPSINSKQQQHHTTSDFFNPSHTVWISVPSVGNVGQLAMDALIATNNNNGDDSNTIDRVGFMESDLVLNMIGNDPFNHADRTDGDVHVAVEVYHWSTQKATLIHIRSPIVHERLFAKQLLQFLADYSVKRVVLLASANSSWKTDRHLQQYQQEDLSFMVRSMMNTRAQKSGDYESVLRVAPAVNMEDEHERLFKSGVTAQIIDQSESKSAEKDCLSVLALIVLCNEGVGNINEGLHLAHLSMVHLTDMSQEAAAKIVVPASWSHLFGSSFDRSLY